MSKLNSKIKALFTAAKALFDEMNAALSDKGTVYWENDLEVGTVLYTESGIAPSGDYAIMYNIYTVVDGVVTEIHPNNTEEPAPEPQPEPNAFGSVITDSATLIWDGDSDLTTGTSVFVEDSEGNRNSASNGTYVTEDGKSIVVVDGLVTEINDPVAEVAPETESLGCASKKFEEVDSAIADLVASIEEVKSSIADLTNRIVAIDSRVTDVEKAPEGALPKDEFKKVDNFTNGIEAIKTMRNSNRIK